MHSSPLHILIIGGGIGGTALALFLKKAGISSTVYEAHTYSRGIGGGLGLAPNGMNVLAALGLAERVKARGSLALENVFYNQRGRVLARMKNGTVEKYGQPGISVMRTALQEVLTEAAQQQGIEIHFQKKLVDITCGEHRVIAHFEDDTSAEGNLLIGADGVHSQTRRLILPDAPKPSYVGIIGIGGVATAADVPMMTQREKQSFNFTYGAKGFFGYAGIADGDIVWWANLPREREMTREELASVSLEIIRKEMLAIYHDYHEPIPTLLRNSHSPVKHNIHDIQSLPTWHKGRVLLIGDAAHAVNPNSGQGASMALEDAMYLAKLLCESRDYERVFARFEQDRKPRVERIVAEGRRRSEDKQVVTPFQQRIREVMMMIFINLFGTKGMDWLYTYKIDWENSA
jgi:2-polyprenyl-6-methoxyphenol hydroxylase-like FAD-dependent oxidoreductase